MNLKLKDLVDMEMVLTEINHQIEKLPLTYEWQFRIFLNQTTPHMACYKYLCNRLLEKRYGVEKYHEAPKVKGKKQKDIKYWELDPERSEEYHKEIKPLEDMEINVFVPKFDLNIIKLSGIRISNEDVLKPILKTE